MSYRDVKAFLDQHTDEIESLSPAAELGTGESLVHYHRTVHVQADAAALTALAREILGVNLDVVRKEMLCK